MTRLARSSIEVPAPKYSPTWLIGATTHAIDRFEADVECILQPERDHFGGTIDFSLTSDIVIIQPEERGSRMLRWRNRIYPPALIDLGDVTFFDSRENQYFNWSHQVNFFLSLALFARSMAAEPITIVLPTGMPRAAFDLYKQFGFATIATDGPVKGRHFAWSVSHVEVVPSARPQLIGPFMSEHDEDPAVFPSFDLPSKVFLSRRGSRSLRNEAELEEGLSRLGFSKIYPEDMSVPEQFALLRQAEDIVAIHGAGMAPLQYRSPARPGVRLVELAPVGHMTRWFALMCEQVGGKYIGVRGRLKPEYIAGLYEPQPFLRFSEDDFEVDPKSLEVALSMIGSI